ncbi:unnamed protein product [Cuscuta campestris]|uniref:Uncharacterized protein n=1 Tax=Cuscuta campestris TaxID=132261 RepID=A0A484NDN5_9ASTE|nr:unnamed protein product [Cuscuta campestris]
MTWSPGNPLFRPGTPPPALFTKSRSGGSTLVGRLIPSRRLSWPRRSLTPFPSASVKFHSKFATPKIITEEPSSAQPLSQPSSQPCSLDEQPAQSHQGTSQPIHSREIYINVYTMEFDQLVQAGQGGQQPEGGRDEEEALQRKRRRAEEVGWIGLEYFTRLVKSKDEEMAAKEADEQAQEKIQRLEAENARSAKEISRLGDELEKERTKRASLAAAWAIQEPEQFANRAIADRDAAILLLQGLYKHEPSSKVVHEIATFAFESGQYDERRALYGILQQRIQGFEPKAFSLPEMHDEAPVPPFPGI